MQPCQSSASALTPQSKLMPPLRPGTVYSPQIYWFLWCLWDYQGQSGTINVLMMRNVSHKLKRLIQCRWRSGEHLWIVWLLTLSKYPRVNFSIFPLVAAKRATGYLILRLWIKAFSICDLFLVLMCQQPAAHISYLRSRVMGPLSFLLLFGLSHPSKYCYFTAFFDLLADRPTQRPFCPVRRGKEEGGGVCAAVGACMRKQPTWIHSNTHIDTVGKTHGRHTLGRLEE